MLSALDETFLHQTPLTFDQAYTSDHRFFDRMWFGGHSKTNIHFLMGLAAYKNTNTFDGYFTLLKDGRQYNLRVSRPLLPEPGLMACGPIAVEIVRPLESIRITVAAGPNHAFSADITFTGTVPCSLEAPHQTRVDGRATQDYSRFDQMGRLDGWIELNGERIVVDGWFGARDHSWGVRPGHNGFMICVLWFDTPSIAGYLMRMENGEGQIIYSHGRVLKRENGGFTEVETASIDHALDFFEDTRICTTGVVTAVTKAGETLEIEVECQLAPICYKGTGYDGGYDDERGLGFHRGNVLESDVYDISHPEAVILPDGREVRPWHREAGAIVRLNGEEGMSHFTSVSSGPVKKYGFTAPIINRRS